MSQPQAGVRRLVNATAIMASGTALSRVLGLVRTILIAFILGNATLRADVFNVAMTVPSSLYILLAGGTLNNVLVPQIVRAVTHDEDGGKAFVDRIMTGFLILLGTLTVVLTLATPLVMSVYASPGWRTPEMAGHWHALLLMSYLTMPQVFFYGVFFLIGQVLNARERFGPMMWAPIVNNVVSIGVLGAYLAVWGTQTTRGLEFTQPQVWLLGIGSTLGIAAQTLVLLPYLKRAGFSYQPRFDLKGTGLGRTFHVAKWMVGYVALTSLAQVVVTNLATGAIPAGSGGAGITAYNNAYLIWVLPHSLLTVSLATAMLPAASRYAVAGDRGGVAAETTRAIRLASTFLLPAALGLGVLADAVTRVAYGNGVGADDYHVVAWTLVAFATGLVPFTVQYLYLRAFYALDNTRTPFLLQIWISGANAALALGLVLAWDHPPTVAARLALAYSLSYWLGAFLTHSALRRRLPELSGRDTLRHLVRLLLAALPAAALAWLVSWWFERYDGLLLRLLGLVLAGVVAVLAFFFTAKRLGIPETTALLQQLRRRGRGDEGTTDAAEAIADTDRAPGPAPAAGPAAVVSGDPSGSPDRDPDGAGVFVPVSAPPAPPSDLVDFPEPPAAGTPEADDTRDGRVLGARFRLAERLAVRSGTETWRADDLVLGRAVLVHLLDPADPETDEVLRLSREAALATDSRFLRVLDVVDTEPGENPYLVYEYAAGQTLEKVLRGGPLTGVEAAWIVREVADALIGLHAAEHYHRHLSPASVLVTTSGNVKVLGFAVNEAARPAGSHLNGEATDVRALGQLLYACLVARWPGGDRYGLPAAPVVEGHPALPGQVRTGVAPAVEQVVDRILSPVPRGHASRLTTAQDVTTQLSLVLGPMGAAHDLRARLHPGAEPASPASPAPPVSLVAPPVPTPASSRFSATAPAGSPESPAEEPAPWVDEALERGDSYTPVPPPAAPSAAGTGSPGEPPPDRRSLRLPLLFGALALVLVVGVVAAVALSTGPRVAPAAAPSVLSVRTADDFDPKADGGSGGENAKQVPLAVDGDPETAWRTERYRKLPTLGGLKPGVGLVLDLGEPRQVVRVEVAVSGSGTDLELRVPAREVQAAPMRTEQQWRAVGDATGATGVVTITPSEPVRTRFLLVYLTSLAPSGEGYFRTGVAEIVVTGT